MSKIITFTSALPHRDIEHAGGKYLKVLLATLGAERTQVVAPPLPSVLRASGLPGHPPHTHVTAPVSTRAARAEAVARRVDPGQPPWSLRAALHHDPVVQGMVHAADVIDFQWQDSIRLARQIRRLAPAATLIGTFHDVQSQKFGRLARSNNGLARQKWSIATQIARRAERQAMKVLDRAVVFSAKDADLLPPGAPISVVDPPLATGLTPSHRPPDVPKVVFVAFLIRPENHAAALWLAHEVWPRVRSRVPSAQLDLVGAGATQELEDAIAACPGVRITGFVPDLDSVLAHASVAAVPLHEGAGVKFKTIEALLAGVPVVTTSIGAEGIEPRSLFWGVADDVPTFADHLASALERSEDAQAVADEAQRAVVDRYGPDAFAAKVASIYGA